MPTDAWRRAVSSCLLAVVAGADSTAEDGWVRPQERFQSETMTSSSSEAEWGVRSTMM